MRPPPSNGVDSDKPEMLLTALDRLKGHLSWVLEHLTKEKIELQLQQSDLEPTSSFLT